MSDAKRTARCRCGAVVVECTGDPVRVSICHCRACQQRSGSAFAGQARFPPEQVAIRGETRVWSRIADSGNAITYHFCPGCGSTIWYQGGPMPEAIAVPIGSFDPGEAPAPRFSVWERGKHPWVAITGEGIEHSD